MSEDPDRNPSDTRGRNEAVTPPHARRSRVLTSREILAEAQEVTIEHKGEFYHLRATRKGKLILTK